MRALQRAVDRYDDLVASRLRINRSDLRCLDLLRERGTMTAGQLAAGSGLSSLAVAVVIGAATAVIAVCAALRYQHTQRDAGTLHPVLFPSDAP